MRRLQEVGAKVAGDLAPDEVVVRETRVHGAWLVLTNQRLLLYGASATGHPRDLVLNLPVRGVAVEWRFVWSRLDRRLVVRSTDGTVTLVRMRSRRSPAHDARELIADVRHWARVAEILAWQAAKGEEGDAALAHLHAKVLEARTPAQLAHDLGLDAQHVRDLLEERLGVHVSRGAALRYSYTRRDLERFDDAAKERLFAALVDDLGADAMVRRAAGVADDWWETSAGKGLDDVLGLADVELGHVSERRAPIARWQSTFLWIGFVVAAVTAIAVIPPAIWLSSWKAWRAGRTGRPAAGIGLGMVAIVAVVVTVVVSAL